MADELVHLHVADAVATITLDSPTNRNALSAALVGQLLDRLATVGADPQIRAVVLTHTGTTFCAGADLTEMSAGDAQATAAGTQALLATLRAIVELPKPVIARVTGHARAGGVGLIGAADVAVGSPAVTFAFSEVRLGLAPAVISLTTSTRLSERATARYYLTGDVFDGVQAAAIGLLTDCGDDVDALVDSYLASLRRCSPQGLAETKALMTQGLRRRLVEDGPAMAALSGRLFSSDEAREGMQAFLERRSPRWADRD